MNGKIVFIGAGAMGGAILEGALARQVFSKQDIYIKEHNEMTCQACKERFGVEVGLTYPKWDDVSLVVLAVKPQVLPLVLAELRDLPNHVHVISIAAGVLLSTLERVLPNSPVHRVMPNTPAAVGCGMTAIAKGQKVTEIHTEQVVNLFQAVGETVIVSEVDLERLGALSGVGPGFCFAIIDALANAGVSIGLSRPLAIKAAAQTLLGSGQMVLQTNLHPVILRDQVTSPGGTTIAGLIAMEEAGLSKALHAGVKASFSRSQELGKESER